MRENWLARRKNQVLSYVSFTHLAGLLLCVAVFILMSGNSSRFGQFSASVAWIGLGTCLLFLYWFMTGYLHRDLLFRFRALRSNLFGYTLLALLFALAVACSSGAGSTARPLLLVPVIIAATASGRWPGMITAAVAGGCLMVSSMLGTSQVGALNGFEANLILTALMLLVGWLIGCLSGMDDDGLHQIALDGVPQEGEPQAPPDKLSPFGAELQHEAAGRRYQEDVLQAQQFIYQAMLGALGEAVVSPEQGSREIRTLPDLATFLQSNGYKEVMTQLVQAQKLEAVGHLAAGVVHEVNNQLTVIQACIDIYCRHHHQDDTVIQAFARIRKAVEVSANLTRKLLLFGRRLPQHRAPANLNKNAAELGETLQPVLTSSGVTLNLRLASDLWTVNADSGNIDQVVVNLVINARDAMPQGGAITIETRNLEIEDACSGEPASACAGRFICLSVSDTGTGMDEQTLSRLFEPFYTTKEEGKGTGLGLAVAYDIIRDHQGWFNVKSRPGAGSRFEIYLPALADETNQGTVP